jgi:regulator of protease activity HflC (stomatin/prohibitin superfamily)
MPSLVTVLTVGSAYVSERIITIACVVDSYHTINEGHVGIYYRHGALTNRVADPGVQFMQPFVESVVEVKIRSETYALPTVRTVTRDGIDNKFLEINVLLSVRKDKLIFMIKTFGVDFKKSLVFDRVKENLRIFCANNTIDDVYNEKYLEIVDNVKSNVIKDIERMGENGIDILNLVIPKPEIPDNLADNYNEVKVQWTEQKVAEQRMETERIKKETEEQKAVADAKRHKAVLKIKIEGELLQKEGERNASRINNEIQKEKENTKADIEKYKLEQEALGNVDLYSNNNFVKLSLAKALSNNTKFYFSGQQSELGALFNQILGN